MSRRRYRTMEACGACGRMVSDEQLASHERVCPAWRRRARETHPEPLDGPVEASGGATGATGGSGPSGPTGAA